VNQAAAADFDYVAVDDVSRHFGRRRAVSRVSFTAREGTILGLLGPNGAGKSTMLAMLATLLRPTAGAIRFGTLDPRAHGAALRGRIGVLGHDLFLYPELTAHENLAFFAALYQRSDASGVATRALVRAGLADRADGRGCRVVLHNRAGVRHPTKGCKVAAAEIIMKPAQSLEVSDEDSQKIQSLIEALEDDDDVISVHSNIK